MAIATIYKHCPRCKIKKDIVEFSKSKSTNDGLHGWCKSCMNKYCKGGWHKWHSSQEKARLKYRYGLTFADYEKMNNKQKGLCSICGKNHGKKLVIDHNHETGKVRGLICQGCNGKIAWFEHYQQKILRHLK